MRLWIACTLIGLSLASPARVSAQVSGLAAPVEQAAAAQPRDPGSFDDGRFGAPRDGDSERLLGWANVGLFGGTLGGQDLTLLALGLGMRMEMAPIVDVELEWGVAYAATYVRGFQPTDGGPDEPFEQSVERVEAGNPVFTLRFHPERPGPDDEARTFFFEIGLGGAIPVAARANAPGPRSTTGSHAERLASVSTLDAWLTMHGGFAPWRFLPERFSLFVPVRVGGRAGILGWSLEAAGGLWVGVLGGSGGVDGMLQLAGDVAFEIVRELRAGVRFGASGWHLGTEEAEGQPFAEPWLRVVLDPMFLTARGLLALGGHRGVGAEGGGVWSISVGGGAAF